MDVILSNLLSYVLLYKYIAIFVAEYSSALIVPLPMTLTLVAIGAFSSQGYFNFFLAFIVALFGNALGDLTGRAITKKWGDAVIYRLRIHKMRFYENIKEELKADALITIFMTRFTGSLATVTNFLAGLVGVSWLTFLIADVLGNGLEIVAALALGRLVGVYWNDFSNLLTLVATIFAIGVIVFVLERIHRRIQKRKKLET